MYLVPDASLLPVSQVPPAGHAAAAVHLLGQILPGDTGLEYEDDSGQDLAVVQGGSASFGAWWMFGQDGFDEVP